MLNFIPGVSSSISPHVNNPSCIFNVPTTSKSLVDIIISASPFMLFVSACVTSIDAFPIVFPLYGSTESITACPIVVAASVPDTPFPT